MESWPDGAIYEGSVITFIYYLNNLYSIMMVKRMGKENLPLLMVQFMKENSILMKSVVTECIYGATRRSTKGTGRTTRCMARVIYGGPMARST